MFYPMFALVVLTMAVAVINLVIRFRAVRRRELHPRYFKTYQADAPASVIVASRNYANLFEMPVLFYVSGILAIITNSQTALMLILAWTYVLCRAVHSYIHLTNNHIWYRFSAFACSAAILMMIWVLLFIRMAVQ